VQGAGDSGIQLHQSTSLRSLQSKQVFRSILFGREKLFPASVQISWPKAKCWIWIFWPRRGQRSNTAADMFITKRRGDINRSLSSVQIQLKLTFSNEPNANCRPMTNVRRQSGGGSSRIFMGKCIIYLAAPPLAS